MKTPLLRLGSTATLVPKPLGMARGKVALAEEGKGGGERGAAAEAEEKPVRAVLSAMAISSLSLMASYTWRARVGDCGAW